MLTGHTDYLFALLCGDGDKKDFDPAEFDRQASEYNKIIANNDKVAEVLFDISKYERWSDGSKVFWAFAFGLLRGMERRRT